MEGFAGFLTLLNLIIWHDSVLFILLGTGVVFTIWSRFSQYRALTHGFHVVRGDYDDPDDPGAISHFQALSAALSATVGLGNIGGVALAIALGGPGAIFWMWTVGFFGMSIKLTEVTQSMLYRNTDDPDNPHGGPMWVVGKGLKRMNPKLGPVGGFVGGLFCLTLLVSTITGGNMFQAWNVGEITEVYFGIPSIAAGVVLAILVGLVIIGGIKRIGAVAGRLVPFMCALYLLGGTVVLIANAGEIPAMFLLIFKSAFMPQEMTGAFIGGTAGYAFLYGMKRALFSNEAGQGSSPIAHSAAKTKEPVREAVVAGMEPFIDTIIVCTFTALVILSTGVWNRAAEAEFAVPPAVVAESTGVWTLETAPAPERIGDIWRDGDNAFVIVQADPNPQTGNNAHRVEGRVVTGEDGELLMEWGTVASDSTPRLEDTRHLRQLRGRDADRQGLRHGRAGPGPVAGDRRGLAFRHLHHDLVELLRRAGRRVPVRRTQGAGLQGHLLPADPGGHHGPDRNRRRPGQPHRRRHRGDAVGQRAHHLDIRPPGHARLPRLRGPSEDREDGRRPPPAAVGELHWWTLRALS